MRSDALVMIGLALVCGMAASVVVSHWADGPNTIAPAAPTRTERIYIAHLDIAAGQPLRPDALRLETWDMDRVPQGAITRLDDVTGKISRSAIRRGIPIQSVLLTAATPSPTMDPVPESAAPAQTPSTSPALTDSPDEPVAKAPPSREFAAQTTTDDTTHLVNAGPVAPQTPAIPAPAISTPAIPAPASTAPESPAPEAGPTPLTPAPPAAVAVDIPATPAAPPTAVAEAIPSAPPPALAPNLEPTAPTEAPANPTPPIAATEPQGESLETPISAPAAPERFPRPANARAAATISDDGWVRIRRAADANASCEGKSTADSKKTPLSPPPSPSPPVARRPVQTAPHENAGTR
jgi:hypothetical protein